MPRKTLILAGAPLSSALTWDPSGLLNDFSPPFTAFLSDDNPPDIPPSSNPSWRSLPLTRQRLETGLSQVHAYPNTPALQPDANFFTTSLTTSTSSSGSHDLTTQFYDHSLAHHTALPSSPVPGPPKKQHPSSQPRPPSPQTRPASLHSPGHPPTNPSTSPTSKTCPPPPPS
ncbi:hypothetical protein BN1723_016107, partial [Verticillium longisporum]